MPNGYLGMVCSVPIGLLATQSVQFKSPIAVHLVKERVQFLKAFHNMSMFSTCRIPWFPRMCGNDNNDNDHFAHVHVHDVIMENMYDKIADVLLRCIKD